MEVSRCISPSNKIIYSLDIALRNNWSWWCLRGVLPYSGSHVRGGSHLVISPWSSSYPNWIVHRSRNMRGTLLSIPSQHIPTLQTLERLTQRCFSNEWILKRGRGNVAGWSTASLRRKCMHAWVPSRRNGMQTEVEMMCPDFSCKSDIDDG